MPLLLREAIGGTIRRARTERRRTLRDVSHEARVSLGYLSEIERGRKEPSSELLAAICEALALPLPDLLGDVADALRPGAALPAVGGHPVAVVDPALRFAVEEALEPWRRDTADPGATDGSGQPEDSGDTTVADDTPRADDTGAQAAGRTVEAGSATAGEAETEEPVARAASPAGSASCSAGWAHDDPPGTDPDSTDGGTPRGRLVPMATMVARPSTVVCSAA